MKRSYLWLLAGVVGAAALVSALGRSPGGRRAAAPAEGQAPAAAILLVIRDGTITPPTVSVDAGSRVALTVSNAGASRASLSLPGYEDRLAPITLEPGASLSGDFLADRPGEDFAWMVDGTPAGRLVVAGSHLVRGHR